MNEEETLEVETSVNDTSEDAGSSEEILSSEVPASEAETTVPYQETIQYDMNYNFGFMSIWFGVVFGALLVLVFMKGFSND